MFALETKEISVVYLPYSHTIMGVGIIERSQPVDSIARGIGAKLRSAGISHACFHNILRYRGKPMPINYVTAKHNAIFCQEVYQKPVPTQFHGISNPVWISKPATDTQCAILPNGSQITIVFRGSDSAIDWTTNFDTDQQQAEFDQQIIRQVIVADQDREQSYPYSGVSSSGAEMHQGFSNAYFSVRKDIHDYLKQHPVSQVTVTGHSLGGALAILCGVDIQYNFASQLQKLEVYTYGAPKVGNKGFRDSYNRRVPESFCFVHGMDIVAALPRWWQGNYYPVDNVIRIGQRFSLQFISARFKDHAITKYIESLTKLATG
jgi:triacylglycerol lipase